MQTGILCKGSKFTNPLLHYYRNSTYKWCKRCLSYAVPEHSYHSSNYQYMQLSKLPTMYFQQSLLRLPIPLVGKSCDKFLQAVEPLLSEEIYQETQKIIEEFSRTEANELNTMLKQKDQANKHTSYISEPWFDMYLRDRAPLPLNYNPLLVMKPDTRPEYCHQVVRAANIVISSLRFWRSLIDGFLEPEIFHLNPAKSDTESYRRWMGLTPKVLATYASYMFKAFPLDMSQYMKLFGTTRIPVKEKDQLTECPNSKHIVIMRHGNLYAVDVLNENGTIIAPKEILSRLNAVIQLDNNSRPTETPLGVLTAGERNEWASVRQHLTTSDMNSKLLHKIDTALFCLCLDAADDPDCDESNLTPMLKHMLAGKAINRWFDKSVSIIIGADSTAAINFEHSWGDGVAVLRYFNELYKETLRQPFVSTQDLESLPLTDSSKVQQLHFEIDEHLRSAVAKAAHKQNSIMNRLQMNIVRYPHLNKVLCKRLRLSPDSIMQLAFQLAFRQAFEKYVSTYESCSTAAFRHGRTEAMRPCTKATKLFCETVLKQQHDHQELNAKNLQHLIVECSNLHGKLTKEAAMGQGFDRHLFALKDIAIANNRSIPALYESEAYKYLNYNVISTSTLSSDALLAGCFGPVVEDGLGIGYSIQNEFCGAIITSYKDGINGAAFAESLELALNTINKILNENKGDS